LSDNNVLAVQYGELASHRSHVFLNYSDYHEPDGPYDLAYYFWLVRKGGRTIVVDTGFSRSGGDRRGRTTLVAPPVAFAALGIAPDFAGEVVLTHAHYDHIGNLGYFTRARFIMSKSEFEFATKSVGDHVLFTAVIDAEDVECLRELHASGRLELIDNDIELIPGIRLVHAPGHTPGQLMVDFDAGSGRVLLTSDAVHFDEELDRDMPFRNMCDLPGAYRSFELVRRLRADGREIIAGHEAAIAAQYPRCADIPVPTFDLLKAAAG
jgi:glyoxylase-like metal-dependent hydrolase (beta-lactamase superfamily II)